MADGIATKKDPKKWSECKSRAKASMGGKHSARAMQKATQCYKKAGGKYEGEKPSAKSNKLKKWGKEDWGTKSGKNSTEGKEATGERYLPKKKRDAMSDKEYARTTAKKRADTAKGKQYSKQPK
tara:strand:+ start:46 stop:417 length:372 start_codon:yes stop_codon:yes gene_type:complete